MKAIMANSKVRTFVQMPMYVYNMQNLRLCNCVCNLSGLARLILLVLIAAAF
jgi:hypothetical protein